ncbi:MAG: hypothetical protein K9W42_03930 [Candidatus Heimdallarchaeota archaeon]|nr:hypothetical protein [Candidatus Heimdallarchaeota archaeon]
MKKFTEKCFIIFLLSSLLCFTFISLPTMTTANSLAPRNESTVATATDHSLQLLEFSHYDRVIYANYSVISFSVLFEGPEVNISTVYAHYSLEQQNWASISLTRSRTVSEYQAIFSGQIGPFAQAGEYYLKINATRFSVEHASLYLQFEVVKAVGIVFVDFSFDIHLDTENNQYADLQITVLGEDVLSESVYVVPTLPNKVVNKTKLYLLEGTNYTYVGKISPINTWLDKTPLTFLANTSSGIQYKSSTFFLLKGLVSIPESFWRSKFPAILISSILILSMSTIFIMARRKPPKTFR